MGPRLRIGAATFTLATVALVAGCSDGARAPATRPSPSSSSSAASLSRPASVGRALADAGSVAPEPTERDPAAEADLVLAIPARHQEPAAPAAGWCGETAIQEGLLHLGVFASQGAINKAGHPVHPDLYATEIPGALHALGVRFTPYPGARGYDQFRPWVVRALDAGHPVLAGVKLVPSEHPGWGLDHFVLVVGYGKRGLLVNTTWGYRAWVAEDGTSGLSFKGAFYGFRLDGLLPGVAPKET